MRSVGAGAAQLHREPKSWIYRYNGVSGNYTISLTQGEYYYFASSNTNAVINTFTFGQSQQQTGSFSPSPVLYLFLSIFVAIGVVFVVFGVLHFDAPRLAIVFLRWYN